MALVQNTGPRGRRQPRADPQLLQSNRILQMPGLELQQCLAQELTENPALESPSEFACNHCEIPGPQCADCPYNQDPFRGGAPGAKEDGLQPVEELSLLGADPLAQVGARQTLQEQLRLQLRTLGDPSDQAPGNYLIANIDPDGYLRCDFREAAQALGVSDADVSRAARLLQSFEPAGVAARSLQECLLLQARALRREPGIPRLLEPLLDRYWKELAAGKWREIARGLRTSSDEVEAAVRWLRLNLTPYPGSRHRPAGEEFFDPSPPPIFPDLRVQAGPAGGLTLLDGSEEPFELHLNPYYARLLQQMDEAPEAFSDAERSHVREYVLRARRLLRSVEERRATLRRIGETLLREQNAYFRTEREEAMRPFTQAQLASLLGLHESTISRALAEKFLQLSSGRVVPLSYFFDRALSHRKLVANIVASEDPAAPLSDQEISDMLKGQGISIARRTVMKYREELNILSSRQRARVRV